MLPGFFPKPAAVVWLFLSGLLNNKSGLALPLVVHPFVYQGTTAAYWLRYRWLLWIIGSFVLLHSHLKHNQSKHEPDLDKDQVARKQKNGQNVTGL